MSTETILIIAILVAFFLIIITITKFKFPPFLGIFIGAIAAGLICGLPVEDIAKSFSKNAGSILGETGFIIAMGAMLGGLFAKTGAADEIAAFILSKTSKEMLPWAMALVAMVIGLPLFFEVGLVLIIPLVVTISRQSGIPLMKIAIPALAGMTTLHAFVPPHPGPIIAIKQLHADMGLTLIIGLCIAIPTVILAGPLYAKWLIRKPDIQAISDVAFLSGDEAPPHKPSLPLSVCLIFLPAILMLLRSLFAYVLPPHFIGADFFEFIGEPLIALTITVVIATFTLGRSSGLEDNTIGKILSSSIAPIAVLILTIGAGGGLKGVLISAGISQSISHLATNTGFPVIVLVWVIAVIVRQATGSATVATTTTAGIVAASLSGLTLAQSSLVALSIGAGSVFFCHVNDGAFWMIKEFFKLNLKQTVWIWSVLQTIVSVMGLILTSVIWYVMY